tara:strand:+ start:30135 stop:30851 length:717 start_codon:yes stop_codon:yes gene_type:complete
MPVDTIITGAGSGIGKSTAELILGANRKVLGLDITDSQIESPLYEHINIDISDLKSIESKNLLTIFSKYRGLVNAAGITLKSNEENKFSNFAKTLEVNLFAPYYLSEIFFRSRKEIKNHSSIVNISSIGGCLGFPNNPGYCASKGGIESLTRSLATDFIEKNIRVNTVRPGYTETPMNKLSLENKHEKKRRANHSLLQRWGEPKEIAETIYFLLSEKASFITGSCITVDGGWTIKGIL